jgi:hypothetical protein
MKMKMIKRGNDKKKGQAEAENRSERPALYLSQVATTPHSHRKPNNCRGRHATYAHAHVRNAKEDKDTERNQERR